MAEKAQNRRAKKYIDRQTQGRIAFIVVINALLYIALLALFIFAPLAYRIYTDEVTPEIQEAAKAFLALHEHFWPAILLVLIVVGFHSIRLSHSLAGPVYRFKQTLRQMQKGNFSIQITLRKKDFFSEMMDEMNETNRRLSADMADLKEKDRTMRQTIEEMNEKLSQEDISIESLKTSAHSISENEKALRHALETFHLNHTSGPSTEGAE